MTLPRAPRSGLFAFLLASAALAQPTPATGPSTVPGAALDPTTPNGVHVVDDSEPKAPLIPRVSDVLGGHVLLGAALGPTWSLGSLASRVSSDEAFGTGLGFRADLGLGVSRMVSLGLWGELTRYGDGSACSSCSGTSYGVGPFVRYHLSQGLRFDPWLLAGAGFRSATFNDEAGEQNFSGVQWLRLELGADYYAWSGVGVGPYGTLGLTSYGSRPEGSGDTTVNTELSVGLRLLLDLPGR